jgi:hypothetical protein
VVQVPPVRVQACLDVAEALTSGQLRECKRVEMTSTTEIAHPPVTTVTFDYTLKCPHWKMFHHLTKDQMTLMHTFASSLGKEVCTKIEKVTESFLI